jgi:predicted GNAT family acetyltransferase
MADIVHVPDASRYEIHVDGQRAGFTHYRETPDAWVFDHTEIDDAYEGQGLGGQLARGALDDVRARGLKVVATCPFIKGWIDKHPDYQDLRRGG